MTDHLQRVDEQAERADEHYEKLCKLEKIARSRIVQLSSERANPSLNNYRWGLLRAQTDILEEILKEAGLE